MKLRKLSMIGKMHLVGKGIGFKRLLLSGLVFIFLTACQTSPQWTPHETENSRLYPGKHWHKVEAPEQLGWSSERLAEARAYSKQIGSAAVMIVDDGVVVDAWGDITKKYQCHSMRKSLMSALIGVHVDEGNMDLSKTMEDFDVSYCRYLSSANYQKAPYSPHRYYLFRVSARDLARFGLLYLREGQWQGQRIVSAEWVKESTANHSKRGLDGGYGYMWWTGVNCGLLPNVNVKAHSYYAAGWGGHRVFVLPYRKLVVVHRVNTDVPGERPMGHHIGRLLWLILSAAGETQIGEDPSIEAATGVRLSTEDLKQLLANGGKWIGDNNGIFPGGDSLVISCSKKGVLSLSASKNLEFKGKWWISKDRVYFNILGMKAYLSIFQRGNTLALYDPTGTLYGKFTISDS